MLQIYFHTQNDGTTSSYFLRGKYLCDCHKADFSVADKSKASHKFDLMNHINCIAALTHLLSQWNKLMVLEFDWLHHCVLKANHQLYGHYVKLMYDKVPETDYHRWLMNYCISSEFPDCICLLLLFQEKRRFWDFFFFAFIAFLSF